MSDKRLHRGDCRRRVLREVAGLAPAALAADAAGVSRDLERIEERPEAVSHLRVEPGELARLVVGDMAVL